GRARQRDHGAHDLGGEARRLRYHAAHDAGPRGRFGPLPAHLRSGSSLFAALLVAHAAAPPRFEMERTHRGIPPGGRARPELYLGLPIAHPATVTAPARRGLRPG